MIDCSISNSDDLEEFVEEEFQFDQKESEDAYEKKHPDSEENEAITSKHFSYHRYSSVQEGYFGGFGG